MDEGTLLKNRPQRELRWRKKAFSFMYLESVANQMVMVVEMPVWTSGRKPLLETWI